MATTSNIHKNTYGKRKRTFKKKSNLDKRIAKVASQVMEAKEKEEVELKLYEPTEVFLDFIDNGGHIFNLSNLMIQGTAKNQRVGNQIKLQSYYTRMFMRGNLASQNYHSIRIIIFRWLTPGDPTAAAVLQLSANTQNRHLSQLNNDNSRNSHIFYDNTYLMSIQDANKFGVPGVVNDKIYIKLKGAAEWSASGTNNERGNLYLLAISDSASIDAPQLSFTGRLRYTDQ